MKGLLITGDRSGSGKTSITLGLAALLSRDRTVQPFKVAMDYIDPSYLTGVTGRPCRNLDSFVMDQEMIHETFANGCVGADIAIVEGVRGLYEGAEALDECGSTASVAKSLGLPVILVVDVRSITRSAAAIVKGFMALDPDVQIKGVILNQVVHEKHRQKATIAIEHYCNIPVIGAIPRTEEMKLTMRHLGLVPYLEGRTSAEFQTRLDKIIEIIEQNVDVDQLLAIADDRPAPQQIPERFRPAKHCDVTIGIARDEAFNFYYNDLFDILKTHGAEPIFFSPIHDTLPEADGYILGGGYPELFCSELEANDRMRTAMREVSAQGVPIYAECGGLLYLTDRIVLKEGWQDLSSDTPYEMCGAFSGETHMPVGRVIGYVIGEANANSVLGAGSFMGHEFHHTDVRLAPDTKFAYCLSRGKGISGGLDGAIVENTQGSYTHLHPVPAADRFGHFVELCRKQSL